MTSQDKKETKNEELQICYINLRAEVEAPIINCKIENNPGFLTFFCDSGAKPNLIRENSFDKKHHDCDESEKLKLVGINPEPIYTWGTVKLKIEGLWTKFHIVTNDFPIETNWLLCRHFFRETGAVINFKNNSLDIGEKQLPFVKGETVILPVRSGKVAFIRIENDLEQGYIRELNVGNLRGEERGKKGKEEHIFPFLIQQNKTYV